MKITGLIALLTWFVILLVNVAIIGGIGCVAWHFISKVW